MRDPEPHYNEKFAHESGAHYSLATALTRAGRKEEADKEFAIQRHMTQKGEPKQGEQAGAQQNPN